MKTRKNATLELLLKCLGVLAFLHVAFPARTYAYIDPGTGSYFLQFLIAGLLGLLYSVKIYWKRIKESVLSPIAKRLKRRT